MSKSPKSPLESILGALAEQPEPRDPQKRRQIELLANVLWKRALDDGDQDAGLSFVEKIELFS